MSGEHPAPCGERLLAPVALLPEGWAQEVLLEVTADGRIGTVTSGVARPTGPVDRLAGPVIPGMANLHSHAFQRAMAGLAETRGPGEDDFWTWRETMYRFVDRLDPEAAEAIATWLYVEMLEAGYTAVAEFHYLHHDPRGRPYADAGEMSARMLAAAAGAGIAITLLPVLYAQGGFGGRPATPAQRRFLHDPEGYLRLWGDLASRMRPVPGARLGLAFHSLRAVTGEQMSRCLDAVWHLDREAPVHIHVAEQAREVIDCLASSGQRPVQWLLDHAPVDRRWCLVHATHLTESECRNLARSGAVAGLCPTTEANLGDGLFPAPEYLGAGGAFGIGSDSQVSVDPAEELRLLEYGQRLRDQRRAILVDSQGGSVGTHLWHLAARGGARALARDAGAIRPGARADLVVLDPESPGLAGRGDGHALDALVFVPRRGAVRDVMVGGRWRVRGGRHPQGRRHLERYRAVVARMT